MTRSEGREAFEMDRETPKMRDRYGRTPVGAKNMLLARRMVEAGVRYVNRQWMGGSSGSRNEGTTRK